MLLLILEWHSAERRSLQHEGTTGVTVSDGSGVFVVQRSLVQVFHPVLLGSVRRGQMPDHHF